MRTSFVYPYSFRVDLLRRLGVLDERVPAAGNLGAAEHFCSASHNTLNFVDNGWFCRQCGGAL